MARVLDGRTSKNASFDTISVTVEEEPALFGQVGLNCINPVGIIRVEFTATVTVELPADSHAALEIFVVRGREATDEQVYRTAFTEGNNPGPIRRIYTVSGSDYNVPPPPSNLLVYTAFFSGIADVGLTMTRIGPENFSAVAYCDE